MKYGPEEWNERYSEKEYVYGTLPNQFLAMNVDRITKGDVLCVADGEGRNGVFLAKLGFNVTSIDFSPQAMEKSKLLALENGVKLYSRRSFGI